MDPITLSDDLIDKLKNVVIEHDARASDPEIVVQYFSAFTGYMLAQLDFPVEQKREYLNQLCEFTRHVFEDCISGAQEPPQSAMGKWKPGDS